MIRRRLPTNLRREHSVTSPVVIKSQGLRERDLVSLQSRGQNLKSNRYFRKYFQWWASKGPINGSSSPESEISSSTEHQFNYSERTTQTILALLWASRMLLALMYNAGNGGTNETLKTCYGLTRRAQHGHFLADLQLLDSLM